MSVKRSLSLITIVTVVCTACTSDMDEVATDSSPSITAASEPTWWMNPEDPLPLTFVWTPMDGVDLDSPPARVVRAYTESLHYAGSHVGIPYGYPGFLEFFGHTLADMTPRDDTVAARSEGTGRAAILAVTRLDSPPGVARYAVDICENLKRVSSLVRASGKWRSGSGSMALREYIETGDDATNGLEIETRELTPIDMSSRAATPEGNLFEGWTLLTDSSHEFPAVPGDSRPLQDQCDALFPLEIREVTGPLPAEPFYPGWPTN